MRITRTKLILAALLSATALSTAAAGTASAGTVVWGTEFCGRVPLGWGALGLGCAVVSPGGNRARAMDTGGLAYYCLFYGLGGGMAADPGCIYLGVGGGFGLFVDPPSLTIKIKGNAYKWKGKVSGISFTIACTSMNAKEPKIESGLEKDAGTTEAASLEYTGCKPEQPSNCEVGNPSKAAGTIATSAVKAELVENLTRSKVENLFGPKSGAVFAEFEFKGASCAISGTKAQIEGTTLTEGGAEDLISDEHKIEAEGKPEDIELVEEDVEKPELLWEASSKKYLNDETGKDGEAKLTIAKEEVTLTGLATIEAKTTGGDVKAVEGSEEVTLEEQSLAVGVGRD
jgi:hypothetical protein